MKDSHIISIKIDIFLFILTELSSQTILSELFPESHDDALPPLRTFRYEPNKQLINLRRIVNEDMTKFDRNSILVARGHIIIGWKKKDLIKPLSNLFGETEDVFDIDRNKFVSLNPTARMHLGINRRLSYIRSNEETLARHRANQKNNHEYYLYKAYNQRNQQFLRGNGHKQCN